MDARIEERMQVEQKVWLQGVVRGIERKPRHCGRDRGGGGGGSVGVWRMEGWSLSDSSVSVTTITNPLMDTFHSSLRSSPCPPRRDYPLLNEFCELKYVCLDK